MKRNQFAFVILLLSGFLLTSCFEGTDTEITGTDQKNSYVTDHFDKQEVTIEMRDGIKLHTSIYSPKDKSKSYPILLKRTPYSCKPYGESEYPASLGPNKYLMKQVY